MTPNSRSDMLSEIFCSRPADFHEVRGTDHLLVWGALGAWMVVDAELYAFLGLFDGRRSLRVVLEILARREGRRPQELEAETLPVVNELLRKKVLAADLTVSPPQEPIRLANITLNLTNRCNLACTWCYNAGRTTDELAPEALAASLESARGVVDEDATLNILGGEPFVDWPRLRRFLECVTRPSDLPILISTNGTLLTDEIVAHLSSCPVDIQVSLDGPEAVKHDAVRGAGAYDRAVEGIRRLVAAGIHVIVSMVYTRDSYRGIERYLERALELGVTEARFIPLRRIGHGLAGPAQAPDQHEVFCYVRDLLARRPAFVPLLKRDFFTILYTSCRMSIQRQGCGIGRRVIFVDADGRVYPCPNHVGAAFECGRLPEDSLADLLNDAPVFRRMRECYNVGHYTRCRGCAFRSWCAGDCRGEVLAVAGKTDAPSPHCAEMRAVLADMMWMVAQEDTRFVSAARETVWR